MVNLAGTGPAADRSRGRPAGPAGLGQRLPAQRRRPLLHHDEGPHGQRLCPASRHQLQPRGHSIRIPSRRLLPGRGAAHRLPIRSLGPHALHPADRQYPDHSGPVAGGTGGHGKRDARAGRGVRLCRRSAIVRVAHHGRWADQGAGQPTCAAGGVRGTPVAAASVACQRGSAGRAGRVDGALPSGVRGICGGHRWPLLALRARPHAPVAMARHRWRSSRWPSSPHGLPPSPATTAWASCSVVDPRRPIHSSGFFNCSPCISLAQRRWMSCSSWAYLALCAASSTGIGCPWSGSRSCLRWGRAPPRASPCPGLRSLRPTGPSSLYRDQLGSRRCTSRPHRPAGPPPFLESCWCWAPWAPMFPFSSPLRQRTL